ncbi:MAG: Lrp/AsnC family transcriptional regulator [Oculatellaceae cyanobacterium Prado106]|nr:Lrp/AsnC family transcriptional regulator [Oculatellaceae cyanobacterium Prado106]
MSRGEIDRYQINDLIERYGLARSAVYKRIENLGLTPQKVGNKAYYSIDQVAILDELDDFIERGGTMPEYLEMRPSNSSSPPADTSSSGLSTEQSNLFSQFMGLFGRMQPQLPESDPLDYFEKLEKACKNGWLLSTSELANILDLSPAEIKSYRDGFTEAGFIFTPAGYRVRGEIAWKISKNRPLG